MGQSVRMVDVSGSEVAIDTKEDLERAINMLNKDLPVFESFVYEK